MIDSLVGTIRAVLLALFVLVLLMNSKLLFALDVTRGDDGNFLIGSRKLFKL